MHINLKELGKRNIYTLLTHTITPRPIAWVLTENHSHSKNYNLAPFSYFNIVSSDPALLMFSVGHKRDGTKKDTWSNIGKSKECVIHIASGGLMSEVNETARPLPHGESEIENTNLKLANQHEFSLPRVAQAPVAFNCVLRDIHLVGNGPQAAVYVEVVSAYIDGKLLKGDSLAVDTRKLDPLARLGGNDYSLLGSVETIIRPS